MNFPFNKPLEPTELGAEQEAALRAADPIALDGHPDGTPLIPVVEGGGDGPTDEEVREVGLALAGAARGLIVVGPVDDPEAVGPAIGDLARATGFPVLGDPLSGTRFSQHCTDHAYAHFVRTLISNFELS